MANPTRYTQQMIEEYTTKGYWSATTLSELWDKNAARFTNEEAIIDSRTRLSWNQANLWIDRLASRLVEIGIGRDEMIVAQLPNCVELCLLRVACEKAGILLMQLLPALRRNEVEDILKRIEPVGVVVPQKYGGRNYLEMIQEIRPGLPGLRYLFISWDGSTSDTLSLREIMETPAAPRYTSEDLKERTITGTDFFLVIHTSGTTGFPKFAEHPVCSRLGTFKLLAENYGITKKDVVSILGPAPSSYNGFGYFAAPLVGAKTVILDRFDTREVLKVIARERITVVGLVPAQLQLIINEPDFAQQDLSSVRLISCMGALLPFELAVKAEQMIGCRVVQCYGGVDTGAITYTPLEDPPQRRFGTVGRPFPGTEIQLRDESGKEVTGGEAGIIWAKGPCLSSGFYHDEKQTWEVWTRDGWTNTGDIGKFDQSGDLLILGRSKDVIIRGGQNIYPAEIEGLLFGHPKIANVAIVSMPDPILGEKACAYVVLKNGQGLTFEELTSYLKQKDIASFKLPERLEIIEKMPIVADTQKIDKKALQKDIAEKWQKEAKSLVKES